jgi:MORN repeat.
MIQNGTYEGDYVDGKRNGNGEMTWSNGIYKEGTWVDDLLEGNVNCTHTDGYSHMQKYKNGEFEE